MLGTLLRDEMRHQGLSVRSAAKAIGVAHTTVQRALDGENLDLSTSEKICKWLKIPLSQLIDTNSGDDDHLADLSKKMIVLLAKMPRLSVVMTDLFTAMTNGELTSNEVEDILSYAEFRLQQRKRDAR